MKKRYLLLCCFLLTIIASSANANNKEAANPEGKLNAVIVISDSPENIKNWLSQPSEKPVRMKRINQAVPHQTLYLSFLTSGVSANENGKFNVFVSFFILKPNQKPLIVRRNYAQITGNLPKQPMFFMADPTVEITFDETDPKGKYQIFVEVIDKVSGKKAIERYIFKLKDKVQ